MSIYGGGGIVNSKAFINFYARTSSLDRTHVNAYMDLLDGLTIDGLFNVDGTSSFFDVLYIFATQNSTTALLNLVSSSFTATANGSPAFTTDRGFTGVDSSNTVFIDSGFNPTTASSPKFTQNSAHLSAFVGIFGASTATGGSVGGLVTTSTFTPAADLNARYSDDNAYFRINDGTSSGGVANAVSSVYQQLLANRSGASAQKGYINAVDKGITSVTSGAPPNGNFYILARDEVGGPPADQGSACQATGFSIGASLTSTQVTNFYNRLRTYMTAVGVP